MSEYTNLTAKPEATAVAEIVRSTLDPVSLGQNDLMVFRDAHGNPKVVDGTDHHDHPRRHVASTVKAYDTTSFVDIVKARNGEGQATVYADPVKYKVVAVINDDEHGPERRDRTVVLDLTTTPQWQAWVGAHDQLMSQADFAQFIEDHLDDVNSLNAADILEIAQSIEAHKSTQFKSAIRLGNGQRKFQHDETITASAGEDGDLEIPDEFEISLAPWVGFDSQPHIVRVRLRYKIGNILQLGFHLVGHKQVLDAAFQTDVVTPIRDADLRTVLGTP